MLPVGCSDLVFLQARVTSTASPLRLAECCIRHPLFLRFLGETLTGRICVRTYYE
jgi:hypothetical protein